MEEKSQKLLQEFNSTLAFDRRLFYADIKVDFAYADALFNAGVLTRLESERIKNGLHTILKRAEHDANYFNSLPFEDVHTFIEEKLVQLVGEPARKILIGRSRAEQTATAFRIWLRDEIVEISGLAKSFQGSLIEAGEKQIEAVLPVFEHSTKTHPSLWADWCLAYYEMISRDRERLDEVWRRVNVLPLGADDNARIFLEIDYEEVARALNFEGMAANNLDAISDRDFVVEFVGACAVLIMHLSRLAADLILYSSEEFQYLKFNHKEAANPPLELNGVYTTALETIRGKSGRIFGHQTAILSTLKGLPLNFSKDLGEALEAVFDTVDTVKLCLQSSKIVLDSVIVNELKTKNAALTNFFNSDGLVEYLMQKNVSIESAQEIAKNIEQYAQLKEMEIQKLNLEKLQNFSSVIESDVYEFITFESYLESKNTAGDTVFKRVLEALDNAKKGLRFEEN
ncbi:MAG: argininosuccinate lyase [Acidobacteria bacterium]|nr:argininosuccinate lyase [Acidobacteriota bacterium]